MQKIFVYGTLKTGQFSHGIISHDKRNKLIQNKTMIGYTLHMNPMGYPEAVRKSVSYILGEIWGVTEPTSSYIAKLEVLSGYFPVSQDNVIFYIKSLRNIEGHKEIGSLYNG